MAQSKLHKFWKPAALIALIAATGVWAAMTWLSYHRGLDRPDGSFESMGPDAGQAAQFRKLLFDELNLSWSQQWDIAKIRATGMPQSPEEFADRLNQMQKVLTPDQRRMAAGYMQDRMRSRMQERLEMARRVLPPDQQEIFEQRLQKRLQDFGSRIDNPYAPDTSSK